MMRSKLDKSAWRSSSVQIEKPWGTEKKWSAMESINGKLLSIKEGRRTSLKYNLRKNEVFYVLSGRVNFHYADESWLHYKDVPMRCETLQPGDSMNIQSHCVYRIKALEDSEVIEIGDLSLSDDAVRIEDDHGRETTSAVLPNKFEE
jgi:mannose-6-phosphate isomerase-like protein (cupin superfamily)